MVAFAQLNPTQRTEYLSVLRTGFLQRLDVDLLDTNEEAVVRFDVRLPGADAEPTTGVAVVAGEVQMDLGSDVSRTCTLEVVDGARKLRYGTRPLDLDDIDEDPYRLYPGKMLRCRYCVWLPESAVWAEVPVFLGPITAFSRQGASVTLQASGKEWLLIEPFVKWRTMNRKAGAKVVDFMLDVLRQQGERQFRGFAVTSHRLQKDYSIARWESTWPNIRRLAQLAGDRLVYYAGDGHCTLRKKATDIEWTFMQGFDVLDEPTFDWDFSVLRNTVAVEWTKGEKRQPSQVVALTASHALGAKRLSRRPGDPLVMASLLQSQTIQTASAATSYGKAHLNRAVGPPVSVSFTGLPIPHLEEYQRVAIQHDDLLTAFTLFSFSLGLMPGGSMSINVNTDQIRKMERVQ
jgi:hypothetical protein